MGRLLVGFQIVYQANCMRVDFVILNPSTHPASAMVELTLPAEGRDTDTVLTLSSSIHNLKMQLSKWYSPFPFHH